MKLLTSLVILCIFLSCQKKDNGLVNQGLSYSVDTVMIDSRDRENQRYLRLSATRVFSDTREEGAFLPELKEIKVYLSIFDAHFKLVAELAIPELKLETATYFAKDGKLWVYENFSDELGFIVVDI